MGNDRAGKRFRLIVRVGLGFLPQFNNAYVEGFDPFTYCKGRIEILP